MDDLRLVETVDRFGECVVVAVSNAADRRFHTCHRKRGQRARQRPGEARTRDLAVTGYLTRAPEHIRSRVTDNTAVVTDKTVPHILPPGIVPDARWSGMYRLVLADGSLSDMSRIKANRERREGRSEPATLKPHDRGEQEWQCVSRCAADIPPEKIDWVWPGRLARGKHTCIAGEPGTGKSREGPCEALRADRHRAEGLGSSA